jgi:uncharacterized OB-fold protein
MNGDTAMNDSKSLRDGLFRRDGASVDLVGGRCATCGHIAFPRPGQCQLCRDTDVESYGLGDKGELFSFTTVHQRAANFEPPFTVGYVRMPSGVRVFSQLRATDGATFEVGMPMCLQIAPLWSDEGADVTGYLFIPAEERS